MLETTLRILVIVLVGLLAIGAAMASLAGCSPTISTWAGRGELGLDNEETAADAWRDLALGHLDIQQKSSIADVFIDIGQVSGGKVIAQTCPSTPLSAAMTRLNTIIVRSRSVSRCAIAAGTISIAITRMLPTLSNAATSVAAVTAIRA